jgi:hypothetical protein
VHWRAGGDEHPLVREQVDRLLGLIKVMSICLTIDSTQTQRWVDPRAAVKT